MILFFTGTGNSEYVAKRIASLLGDDVLNLFSRIRNKDYSEIHSEKPFVVVCPTYAWQIPQILRDYLKNTALTGSKQIYFAMTCGDSIGDAGSYLEIQQFRYQDRMDYVIDIENEVAECKIPKLTLQPLVENALYHGIKNKRGKGRIRITGKIVENGVEISVEDDGIGMDEERLALVRDKLSDNFRQEEEVFGLHNVNERIKLKFGREYGISVESTYGEGTVVKVVLPDK